MLANENSQELTYRVMRPFANAKKPLVPFRWSGIFLALSRGTRFRITSNDYSQARALQGA
jgi:hypothetical protein